jgi:hypothetical protein
MSIRRAQRVLIGGTLTAAVILSPARTTGLSPSISAPRGDASTQPVVQGAANAAQWTPERTADGQPDIQGTWNSINAFLTPFERPAELSNRELTATERQGLLQRDAERRVGQSAQSYLQDWYEFRLDKVSEATSLIVDPPDGRLPPMTEWAAQRKVFIQEHQMDSYELLDPGDRCITRGLLGMMLPHSYNNGKQILQSKGYVTILSEMVHEARIIPLDDDHPRLAPGARAWTGYSSGYWQGNTLVVETHNFKAIYGFTKYVGIQTESLSTIERFTPINAQTLMYRVTVEDPQVFTAPWTVEFPFERDTDYRIYEYACHEGNRAIEGLLGGARAEERVKHH